MVFSSIVFLCLFLPVVLTVYHLIALPGRLGLCPRLSRIAGNLFLLSASLLFYFWGENWRIWIMLLSSGIDYGCALLMARAWRRGPLAPLERGGARRTWQKLALLTSIVGNLSLLGFFKYANFAQESLGAGLASVGLEGLAWQGSLSIALPLGISFYTFQSMSYTIDVYRGNVAATRNPLDFACYVSLFPQLVAGPIVRYVDVAEQLVSRTCTLDRFTSGVTRFAVGLGKKVLIANTLAGVADPIFALPAEGLSASVAWVGIVAYSLQIFFDFSGYSDMAIGLGRMFGFEFLENFDYPYAARSVQDFWRRWHISLSTWFRDYLYVPLGGSRGTAVQTYRNLFVVFFLCGLWHGAGWTFIAWGLWHGGFLVLERVGLGRLLARLPAVVGHAYALLAVMGGWVLFRAESLAHAATYYRALAGLSEGNGHSSPYLTPETRLTLVAAIALALPWSAVWQSKVFQALEPRMAGTVFEGARALAALTIVVLSATWLAAGGYNPFIYFRF
jgi:alginate O-acetyltransferase complex protein AlgI